MIRWFALANIVDKLDQTRLGTYNKWAGLPGSSFLFVSWIPTVIYGSIFGVNNLLCHGSSENFCACLLLEVTQEEIVKQLKILQNCTEERNNEQLLCFRRNKIETKQHFLFNFDMKNRMSYFLLQFTLERKGFSTTRKQWVFQGQNKGQHCGKCTNYQLAREDRREFLPLI